MNEEKLFHLNIPTAVTAKYAILPGDPGRVPLIASYLDNAQFLAENREFTTYVGELHGETILVTSTGIGGASAAIALEELHMLGVDTIIRVGTCGGMQENIYSGDIVIATSAVRAEGTSKEYAPSDFPAVSDFFMVSELVGSAKAFGTRYHIGVVHSKDSFYGQHNHSSMPVANELKNRWEAYIKCGVLASEMETAALFTVSAVRGIRAGSVLLAIWNQERKRHDGDDSQNTDTECAVKIAVNALNDIVIKDKRMQHIQ